MKHYEKGEDGKAYGLKDAPDDSVIAGCAAGSHKPGHIRLIEMNLKRAIAANVLTGRPQHVVVMLVFVLATKNAFQYYCTRSLSPFALAASASKRVSHCVTVLRFSRPCRVLRSVASEPCPATVTDDFPIVAVPLSANVSSGQSITSAQMA